MFIQVLFSHLILLALSQGRSSAKVTVKWNFGTKHYDEVELIDLKAISPELTSMLYPTTDSPGLSFTHGGATRVKVTEVNNNNNCTSYIYTTASSALVCYDQLYLLDNALYTRSAYIKLKSEQGKVRRFRSWTYFKHSMVLLSALETPEPLKKELSLLYVNSFDSTHISSKYIFYQMPFKTHPVLRYLKLFENDQVHLVAFDGIELAQTAGMANNGQDRLFIKPCDTVGFPNGNVQNLVVVQALDPELKLSEKVTLRDAFDYKKNIMVFYHIHGDFSLKAVYITFLVGLGRISSRTDVPIFLPAELDQKLLVNSVVQFIDQDMVFFYFADLNQILICRIVANETHVAAYVGNCSNTVSAEVNDRLAESIFKISKFDTMNYVNVLRFHVEIKLTDTRYTVRSIYYIYDKVEGSLVKANHWDIVSKYHYVTLDLKTYTLVSFREKYLEYFDSKMLTLALNYSLLTSKALIDSKGYSYSETHIIYPTLSPNIENIDLQLSGTLIPSYVDYVNINSSKSLSALGYKGASSIIHLKDLDLRANNLSLASNSKNIFIDYLDDDIQIDLYPVPTARITKVVLKGDYLVGIDDGTDRDRIMWMYKCARDIIVKDTEKDQYRYASYQPSYSCRLIKKFPVNNLVQLAEMWDLPDYVLVRFRSDNSVVYYRVDKYEFQVVEVNLKGYDPSKVWVVQKDTQEILILHGKPTSNIPFMLFSLKGRSLSKLIDPNLQPFSQGGTTGIFMTAGLFIDQGTVHIYVGLTYPITLGFAKFIYGEKDGNINLPLDRSGYDLLQGTGLNPFFGDICFLNGRMFVANLSSTGFDSKTLRAFLIDLQNPSLQYEYPLSSYPVNNIREIVASCFPANNIIAMTVKVSGPEKSITFYLNGNFTDSNWRVMYVTKDKIGTDCILGSTTAYFVETCMLTRQSHFSVSSRFIRLLDRIIYVRHEEDENMLPSESNEKFEVGTSTNTQVLSVSVSSIPYNQTLDAEFKSGYYAAARDLRSGQTPALWNISSNETVVVAKLEEILHHQGHFFRAKVMKKLSSDAKLTEIQPHEDYGVKVLERIRTVYQYEREKEDRFASKQPTKDPMFPDFQSLIKKGRFLVSLSISFDYIDQLQSMIYIYDIDEADLIFRLISQHFYTDVCTDMDFVEVTVESKKVLFFAMLCGNSVKRYLVTTGVMMEGKIITSKPTFTNYSLKSIEHQKVRMVYFEDKEAKKIGVMIESRVDTSFRNCTIPPLSNTTNDISPLVCSTPDTLDKTIGRFVIKRSS